MPVPSADEPEPPRRGRSSAVLARLAAWSTAVANLWRRSLQVRVGTSTFVIAGVVVVVIGLLLVDKVASGVLQAKRDSAVGQAKVGLQIARAELFDKSVQTAGDVQSAQQGLQADLTASGTSAGLFSIVLVPAGGNLDASATVPERLRSLVRSGNLAVQYAPVPSGSSGTLVKGLIVGEPVEARTGSFELYYLFPLTAEAQTIDLVDRTALFAGLALVLLVVIIALLVTRQVVGPIRLAAETAGKLAAGDLEQRIPVRGLDDTARLGRSFNDMAGSLQRQIKRLEDLSRLQRRFTSDVSHELRTPLTTIRMASELLYSSRDEFPPALARSVELLRAELDRFEALLGDLLEISRYDAGVARLESETVDLRGVVAAAAAANEVLATRHGTRMIIRQPDEPVTVDMDSRRVERILRNLIGNALDHGEGRPIDITIAADREAAAVTVRDYGVGLKPGEAGMVFNRFWRGDPSRSRLTGGTGLGLAIALEDARLHDGWLQAWGERGRGAQFRLTLPRHAGHTLMSSPLPLVPPDLDEDIEPAPDIDTDADAKAAP
ncbi:MAG: MtrAB system histidine kinase MtrB [Jatrophihabitans sp.]|uniref:MtrAB system histidine kinase MtrB n=1 Tax=Jatrophihabitans sp. TaxID=1932789 RepID=UPI003F809C46